MRMHPALFLAVVMLASSNLACTPLRAAERGPLPPFTALPPPDRLPPAQSYVAPDLEGIYADLLRAPAPPSSPERLRPYVRYPSPPTPADPRWFAIGQIVVKFVEGSGVRMREQGLVLGSVTDASRGQLSRFGLEPAAVEADLKRFSGIVAKAGGKLGRGIPNVGEADLDRLRQHGQARGGNELPDLNLFYFVHLDHPAAETAKATLDAIQALASVESAYFQPLPFGAADVPPPTNIDVVGGEGYFRPAPAGIDADYARRFPGGRGNAVRIADIEAGWDDSHEDLPALSFRLGQNWAIDEKNGSHGAAVLGELVADENGFGANGLVPNAIIGWSSVTSFDPSNIFFYSVANALLATGRVLRAGDIALIEQQFAFSGAIVCNPATDPCGDCTMPHWVAVEEYPQEHAAISIATAAGVVVVEAAGNGRMQVTPASSRDSGAIVVGAGTAALAPQCWSNFGTRVDVQAWGGGIGTLGYGGGLDANGNIQADPSLRMNGADHDQWYTTSFGGTSGASPIVTAAAAVIQATRTAAGLPKLGSADMRALLVSTGTPQAVPVARKIGPQPDLRAAMATFKPDAARFVQQSSAPASAIPPGSSFAVSETFENSGGAFWTGDHTLVVAPSAQSGVQQFVAASFSLGSASASVGPGDRVAHAFSVTAPAQAGTYSLGFLLRNAAGQTLASSPSQTVVVASPGGAVDNARVSIDSAPDALANGASGPVTITVTNTGNTTWTPPAYGVRLSRFNRVSLPQPAAPLPGPVAPNASVSITFDIACNGTGTGWFSASMAGQGGLFGATAAKTIVCR